MVSAMFSTSNKFDGIWRATIVSNLNLPFRNIPVWLFCQDSRLVLLSLSLLSDIQWTTNKTWNPKFWVSLMLHKFAMVNPILMNFLPVCCILHVIHVFWSVNNYTNYKAFCFLLAITICRCIIKLIKQNKTFCWSVIAVEWIRLQIISWEIVCYPSVNTSLMSCKVFGFTQRQRGVI